ncbi:MAG: protoporphyrinogen oxidase [Acidobacteria bacterium RIFCSPLOWO2_02_FULL_67_36]|nr:MAG: protoporphyrinogen oxidase [Acidobacteria bacterium RIFCSPLOWO2_02_FULL_67_36]OFW25047.1 MAG: protoporphyrinogen oxidase [Acidobacteria bacterium RIFCSPLOWO2_12_FULL_66_21]
MIAIIGGGITGLSAAYELTRRGVPFRLFEASSRPGGLILTEHVDGFTIEAGPDAMLAQKPAAIQLCEELGLGPRLISTTPPRAAHILAGGRLHALPSPSVLGIPLTWRALAEYDLLPWRARARLALEPLVRARRGDDESVAQFFGRRFGRRTVDLIAEPLIGGIHAGDIETLSMPALFPRFTEAERGRGGVLRAFRRSHRARGEGLFRSLASGMGEMVAAIAARLPPGSITYEAPVDALGRDALGWRIMAGGIETRARTVILAVPAHAAARLLAPLDARAAGLCASVPYVSTASVALAWPRRAIAHPLAGSGLVVARRHSDLRITACTWVSSKWAGRAPAGSALLRIFIGGAHDPGAVDLSDGELARLAEDEIRGVLRIEGPPILTRVHRWRNAGAQYIVGHLARAREVEARLSALGGLQAAGSGFRSIGIPDCVADGRAAAAAAAEYAKMNPA